MANQPVDRSARGNRGKWAEGEVEKWLDQRSDSDHGFAWKRYPDSRSARGALSAQPSDMLVAVKFNGSFHLEVKETAAVKSLPKSKLRQYGQLLKWHLAGIKPVVLVYITTEKMWTYLDDIDLFNEEKTPKSFPLTRTKTANMDELLSFLFGPIRHHA